MASFVSHLCCSRCGRRHDHRRRATVCSCGGPLLVQYVPGGSAAVFGSDAMSHRPATMWRYRELLPIEDPEEAVSLGEGFTPLLPVRGLGQSIGLPDLWVKDEGPNPTGTFKARGAACGISRARELGVTDVALATAGNAGAAWAAYGAAGGVRVHVAMPADSPPRARELCRLFGAHVELVDGLITDAGRLVARWIEERDWFDVSTLREPYRIEGKKTLGFEIAEQLNWSLPGAVIYPAGGGVGLIGIWRAFEQLRASGVTGNGESRLIVTQAAGCAPLVRAFEEGAPESTPWSHPVTLAHGLRVPKAFGDFLVLRAVRETNGTAVAVTDAQILDAMELLGGAGIAACPEGAATLCAARSLVQRGDLSPDERVVLINTGRAME